MTRNADPALGNGAAPWASFMFNGPSPIAFHAYTIDKKFVYSWLLWDGPFQQNWHGQWIDVETKDCFVEALRDFACYATYTIVANECIAGAVSPETRHAWIADIIQQMCETGYLDEEGVEPVLEFHRSILKQTAA